VPGALTLIEHLLETGVRVAIGHTVATPEQIADAIRAGASLATHLGNGCPQMLPRHPNVIWELLAADAVFASLIVDGHHLPPATVKAMIRAKGPGRTILVTDAVAAAASGPGRYTVGDVECESDEDGRVSLPGTPYLAGSSLTLERAIANTVRFTGLTLDAVVPMASTVVVAWAVSTSLALPIAVILPFSATMVSASRIGFSIAPDSNSPILRITSLLGPVACGASWAMRLFLVVQCFRGILPAA